MVKLEAVLLSLLALAQIAIAVVATDVVLGFYADASFLSGFLKNFAYVGALIGIVDQVYWLVSSRLPKVADMY